MIDSLHDAADLDPEIREMKVFAHAAIEGEEMQKKIGHKLLIARERWPKSGPKAGGWASYLAAIGITKTQAQDWMNLASIGRRRRGGAPTMKPTAAHMERMAERLSYCEMLKFDRYWKARIEARFDRDKHDRECPECNPALKAPAAPPACAVA